MLPAFALGTKHEKQNSDLLEACWKILTDPAGPERPTELVLPMYRIYPLQIMVAFIKQADFCSDNSEESLGNIIRFFFHLQTTHHFPKKLKCLNNIDASVK